MSTPETYGRYQLVKRIATGGMAQIYLARQSGLEGFEKLLVVKRILPHLAENAEFVRMFLDEARIAARLNHPNVVQIFDLGAEEGTYFIAMEYIHGEDVRRVWKRAANRGTQMPFPLVCRVVMDACSGLDYAHKKTDAAGKPLGIVHRDISPQNILVTFEGGTKVVDFGIAKAADQATVTRSGVLKGKYSYMSPEQANGKKLDSRSDIFALGIVLHELLTGNRLFKRANDIQTLNAVTECAVPPPSSFNPEIPPDLDAVVMRALAKEPAERYQDATALQVALEGWLIKHQLPSSSAHLAAFMQELYLDRLEREKVEGQVLVEEASEVPRSSAEEELRPPRPPASALREASRSGTDRRTDLGEPSPSDLENTYADRPNSKVRAPGERTGEASRESLRRSGDRAGVPQPRFDTDRFRGMQQQEPGEESLANTQTTEAETQSFRRSGNTLSESAATLRQRRRWPRALLLCALSVAALGAAGAGGYQLFLRARQAPPPAEVRISTSPPGATVFLDGRPIPGVKTPCTLPPVPAGDHALLVGLGGFIDHHSVIHVPESGVLEVPLIPLAPEPPPVPATAQNAAPSAPPPPPEPSVLVVRSQPAGGAVSIDGESRGRAPVQVQMARGSEVAVRVELAGYQPVSRRVRVDEARREEVIPLERVRDREREREKEREKERAAEPRPLAKGKVRFVVTPWATVSCGTFALGTTPFPDQELPAGSYVCQFSNPDHPTITRRVEVKPNSLGKVLVQF